MGELILQIVIGLLLIVLGILNMMGNISMLHSYHTKRVKEEDRIPFGRKVGIGSIIVGVSIILAGIFTFINYSTVSNVVMLVGLAIGLIIIFYAMFKYNKGIF